MSPILKNILFAILFVIIVLVIYYLIYKDSSSNLSGMNPANEEVTIDGTTLESNENSNNYAYSIWFYVSDWQTRLTDKKTLLTRATNDGQNNSNPLIEFSPYQNDINITINTTSDTTTSNPSTCNIRNFPLQRWVNLIISLNGRTLDVYLDGKLIRTCILEGVPVQVGTSDILITPGGGFAGYTSKLKFFANPLNPQQAYNIYKEGPASSNLISNLYDKYKIQVTYLVDNVEEGSFTI